jgi:hypothetical protein
VDDDWIRWWELASYVVTVVGLPLAIVVFMLEQRKQRLNEEHEIQQTLAESYTDFLKLVLENPDLKLLVSERIREPSEEDSERIRAIFSILVSLFERAFVLTYDEKMKPRQRRYWQSWEDFMREWCARAEFRELLPELLQGEDPEFAAYITRLAREAEAKRRPAPT